MTKNGIITTIILILLNAILCNINISKINSDFNESLINSINNNLIEENNLLKNYLNIEQDEYKYTFTRGIFVNLYKKIIIRKGSISKIKVGDAVISGNTLIGFINKTYRNNSIISLIGERPLSVRINNEYGILQKENNKLVINGLKSANIGDNVYTSGLTNVIANLYIGKIVKIKNNNYIIDQNLSLNNYRYLLIIGNKND